MGILLILLPVVCPHAAAMAARIRLHGAVPTGINAADLRAEYARIESLVSAYRNLNPRPLTIIYYSVDKAPALSARLPEWGGGGTLGPDSIIIPVDKPLLVHRNIRQVTVHEMVHAILERVSPGVSLPRWFHEGCAMTLAGELSFEETLVLARAVIAGKLLGFEAIDSVNVFDQAKARLAYSQSHAAFVFLLDAFGMESVPKILTVARQTGSFAAGMHQVLGIAPEEFERLAMQHIRKRYGLATVLGDFYLVWLLIIALAVAAFVAVRLRNRSKARAMETAGLSGVNEPEQEPADGTANAARDDASEPDDGARER
ncbi:MAG: hypothetical protein GF331_06400 [Chitinivibrionales bacterium]|nr:hypothetical protein [Chitinivibrionales bacterium]